MQLFMTTLNDLLQSNNTLLAVTSKVHTMSLGDVAFLP